MTIEENNYGLVQNILKFINENEVKSSTIDNVSACLAKGSIHRACQHLWGINPPAGVKVSGNFAYRISN